MGIIKLDPHFIIIWSNLYFIKFRTILKFPKVDYNRKPHILTAIATLPPNDNFEKSVVDINGYYYISISFIKRKRKKKQRKSKTKNQKKNQPKPKKIQLTIRFSIQRQSFRVIKGMSFKILSYTDIYIHIYFIYY